jgi:hypothetical protein
MKKNVLWFLPGIVAIAFLLTAFGGENTDYPGGSPGGYTGSPGDGHNCSISNCHGGSASSVTGWITSNIPAEGYTPGSTYTITATATGSGKKGFEISPQTVSGTLLGTLTPGPGTELCNGSKAVTQSSSVSGSSATWTFSWHAPAAGTGSVTFYGAFAVSISSTKLTTMTVNEAVSLPLSATATASPSLICSGQSSQLGVDITGGTPPYTFSWTSNPPGFSSSLQNPTVSPVTTTIYSVQVGDGTSSVNSSTTVTVNQPPQSFAGIDTTYCKDIAEIPLHGTSSNYSSVAWTTSGDGTFSTTTALNSIYFPGTSDRNTGWVNLYLTASPVSPCSNSAPSSRHIIFDPCTGINETVGLKFNFTISPNPTSGLITLNLSGLIEKNIDVMIFDNQGREVFSSIITCNNSSFNLDLSSFKKGVYFLKAKTNNEIKTAKVVLM